MSKEFKIGIITAIALGLLYYGFNFLRGNNVFSSSGEYYVKYTNVGGLGISNPVQYNGLKVGRVSNLRLDQEKGVIIVSLNIKDEMVLRKDAVASLANDGLLGGKAIILSPGKSSEKLEKGDTLQSSVTAGMLDQFEPMAHNMETTMKNMNTVLANLAKVDFKSLVDTMKYSVASTTGNLNRKINGIPVNTLVNNANSMVVSTKSKIDKLDGLINSSQNLVDSLSSVEIGATVQKLNKTLANLEELTTNLKGNKGTLGKLMNNDSVYNALNKLLVDLDELATHFNEYPKDFLGPLGRKHKRQKGLDDSKK